MEAVKRVHGRDTDEAKRQLAAVTIEASERAGRVEISTSYPHKQNNISVDVDYTVQVPGVHHGVGAQRLRGRPS